MSDLHSVDIADYNARWLAAWTAKSVEDLCKFYAADCVYRDPQMTEGLTGVDALRAYLTGLFAATPAIVYSADEVWPIPGGFCGRWFCDVSGGVRMRGFDLVILRAEHIILNEVYVHQLAA